MKHVLLGLDGSLDRTGVHDRQKRVLDGIVDAQASEGNAALLAIVELSAMTGIPRDVVLYPGIADGLLPAAVTAPRPSGEQSRPLLRGAVVPATLPDQERKIHLTHLFRFTQPPLTCDKTNWSGLRHIRMSMNTGSSTFDGTNCEA